MDEHDKALDWAKANPQDPLAQDVMAKAWAAKNPDHPLSAQVLAKAHGEYESPDVMAKGSTLDNVKARLTDPNRWQAIFNNSGPAGHPDIVAGTPPMAIPAGPIVGGAGKIAQAINGATGLPEEAAAQAPEAMSKLADFLSKSLPRRLATNTAVGAAQGAMHDPNDRTGGAARGGLIGLGAGAVGEAVAGGLRAKNWLGEKAAGMSPEGAQAYSEDPELAEQMGEMTKTDEGRSQLGDIARSKTKEALGNLYKKSTVPTQEMIGKAGVGRSVQVNPSDFDGTEAQNEIRRSWDAQGNKTELPQDPADKYFMRPASVQPADVPESHNLTVPQALSAKKAAQEAAHFRAAANPIAPTAAEQQAAQANAKAGSDLRKGIEGALPEQITTKNGVVDTKDLLDQLAENARASEYAKRTMTDNPAKILNSSDSIGNVPMSSLRDTLDSQGGSNLGELARALQAGKEAVEPGHTALDRMLYKPGGKLLLRTGPDAEFGKAVGPTLSTALQKKK